MTNFVPTPEQADIISAARDTEDNLLISALAGAAKTSTLVLIAEALPSIRLLCLAFNVRIKKEMEKRMPDNATVMTLNGLGHRVWSDTIGRRLELNTSKTYGLTKALVEDLGPDDRKEAYEYFSDITKAIDFGKTCGYVPDGAYGEAQRLMDDSAFFAHLDEEPTPLMMDIIRQVSTLSIKRGLAGEIDFADQLLLPTIFRSSFPRFPLVLTDESQDFSALNHVMLGKLVRQRIIAVGDECQSIYAFRGASEDSMELLRQEFSMRQLVLSISFRCPKEVIRAAQWRAPHMQWPEWAKEGEVRTLSTWSVEDIPADSAIICRNNAPLFAMAIRLLKERRPVELIGNDIGKYLVKVMKKLGNDDIKRSAAKAALMRWRDDKLRKARNKGPVLDQYECIKLFLNEGETLRQAIAYAEHIFNSTGPVKLMTGHKSKGLEFPHVFFLDPDLVRMKEPQDRNLKYVIQTRAQETLTYVQSETFVGEHLESDDDLADGEEGNGD